MRTVTTKLDLSVMNIIKSISIEKMTLIVVNAHNNCTLSISRLSFSCLHCYWLFVHFTWPAWCAADICYTTLLMRDWLFKQKTYCWLSLKSSSCFHRLHRCSYCITLRTMSPTCSKHHALSKCGVGLFKQHHNDAERHQLKCPSGSSEKR